MRARRCESGNPWIQRDDLIQLPEIGAIGKGRCTSVSGVCTSILSSPHRYPLSKAPPQSYTQPGIDVEARLGEIKDKINSDSYDSQYDFDVEFALLARATNDYHFNLNPGLIGSQNWAWSLQWTLTTISADGKALPQVYVYEDIEAEPRGWDPSPITMIGGVSAMEYLADIALNYNTVGVGESHAEWNIMIRDAPYTFGSGSVIEQSLFTVSKIFRGETLDVAFANGTKSTWDWVGYCSSDMTQMDWTSADNIYNTVVLTPPSSSSSSSKRKRQDSEEFIPDEPPTYIYQYPYYVSFVAPAATETAAPTITETGVPSPNYPYPDVAQEPFRVKGGKVSGYLYTNESVAVISLPSFEINPKLKDSITFCKAISDTLIAAKKAGVKKIVLDISGNGGGTNRGQVRPPLEGGCQSCDTPIHVTQSPPQNL